jgi:vancomycin resistance protein VanJ
VTTPDGSNPPAEIAPVVMRAALRILLLRLWRILRTLLLLSSSLYATALVLLYLAFRWIGESNPTLAVLLYVPQTVWFLPLAGFLPLALLLHRPSALILIGASLFTAMLGGFEFSLPGIGVKDSLGIMTYNYGQHGGQSMRPFLEAENPDIVTLQEAERRAAGYRKTYPEFQVQECGEFLILSKLPFATEHPVLVRSAHHRKPIAARFELIYQQQRIVFYSVHLPTPRDQLYGSGLRTLVAGLLPLPGLGDRKRQAQQYWTTRVEIARELHSWFASETLPLLVAGDFNTPQHGKIHSILFDGLIDSHEQKGTGFGFTFPGTTGNPLAFGGPWLRIDYVGAGSKHWRCVYARAEPDRPSQHRSYMARFVPR